MTRDQSLAPRAADGRSPGWVATGLRRFASQRIPLIAAIVLVLMAVISFSAPMISSVTGLDPSRQNLLNDKSAPSGAHWLGTDVFGRDVLIRILYAGIVSMGIGVIVAAIHLVIGVPSGLAAGYFGGVVDDIVNAVIQIRQGIPLTFFLILLSAIFRGFIGSPIGLAITFGLLGWTSVARQVRNVTLAARNSDYIEASRAVGASHARILLRHILPNVMYVVIVVAGFDMVNAMLFESSLSVLGLGIQAPTSSWGNMLAGGIENFQDAPWLLLAPGAFIWLTVLCIFLVSDGLRDAFDPRLSLGRN